MLIDWSAHPTDYSQTKEYLRLVMIPIALCCIRQSWADNIKHYKPEIWPWPMTLTWPLSKVTVMSKHDFLTYNLDLQTQPSQDQGQPPQPMYSMLLTYSYFTLPNMLTDRSWTMYDSVNPLGRNIGTISMSWRLKGLRLLVDTCVTC